MPQENLDDSACLDFYELRVLKVDLFSSLPQLLYNTSQVVDIHKWIY